MSDGDLFVWSTLLRLSHMKTNICVPGGNCRYMPANNGKLEDEELDYCSSYTNG